MMSRGGDTRGEEVEPLFNVYSTRGLKGPQVITGLLRKGREPLSEDHVIKGSLTRPISVAFLRGWIDKPDAT